MATTRELSLAVRAFLRVYPWRRIDPVPWAPLAVPLSAARVALVTSAGLVPPGQPPFDESVKGGDSSFREISNDVDVRTLIEYHRSESFDHAGLQRDANLAFPLDRLCELAARGGIGSAAPRHLSFMGSITAPGRLVDRSAPQAASVLAADGVQAALLVPV